jgi:hypothetical protein
MFLTLHRTALSLSWHRRMSGRTTACLRKQKKRMCRSRSVQSEFPHRVVVNGSTQISASGSYTCSGQSEFPHRVSFETVTCFRLDFWKSVSARARRAYGNLCAASLELTIAYTNGGQKTAKSFLHRSHK